MLSKKPQNSHGTRRVVCVTGHQLYHSDSFSSAGSSDCIKTGDVECGIYMRDKSTILISPHISIENINVLLYSHKLAPPQPPSAS